MRCGYSPEKILFLSRFASVHAALSARADRADDADVLQRFFRQQYKRSCVPDGPKVGTVSLSPRGDWRMPSDADPAEWLTWDGRGEV